MVSLFDYYTKAIKRLSIPLHHRAQFQVEWTLHRTIVVTRDIWTQYHAVLIYEINIYVASHIVAYERWVFVDSHIFLLYNIWVWIFHQYNTMKLLDPTSSIAFPYSLLSLISSMDFTISFQSVFATPRSLFNFSFFACLRTEALLYELELRDHQDSFVFLRSFTTIGYCFTDYLCTDHFAIRRPRRRFNYFMLQLWSVRKSISLRAKINVTAKLIIAQFTHTLTTNIQIMFALWSLLYFCSFEWESARKSKLFPKLLKNYVCPHI